VARIRWNAREAERLFNSQSGPVGRDLARKGRRVEEQQRRTAPVSPDGSHGRPPGYLRDHTYSRLGRDDRGLHVDVGTDATTPDGFPYPLVQELGSRPHVIESKGDYPLRNPQTGQVFGKRVQHPGTDPQPWLRPSLDVLRGE
jgi:hypothetical protein